MMWVRIYKKSNMFSTIGGYSLDIVVVDGWSYEETEQFKNCFGEGSFEQFNIPLCWLA